MNRLIKARVPVTVCGIVLVVLKDRQPNSKWPRVWLPLLPRPLDSSAPPRWGLPELEVSSSYETAWLRKRTNP